MARRLLQAAPSFTLKERDVDQVKKTRKDTSAERPALRNTGLKEVGAFTAPLRL
jgi:hypothetical protein